MKSPLILISICCSLVCFGQNLKPSGMVQLSDSVFIDDSEITNVEYRQFMNWVKDSIAKRKLFLKITNENKFKYGQYVEYETCNKDSVGNNFIINWDKKSAVDYSIPEINFLLTDMYNTPQERFYGRRRIDCEIAYNYRITNKVDTITYSINIYPDTLGFYRLDNDFTNIKNDTKTNIEEFFGIRNEKVIDTNLNQYQYNEISYIVGLYGWHNKWNEFPAVNLTYIQMKAYTHWRNKLFASKESKKVGSKIEYVIPSKDLWIKAYNNMRLVVPYDYFDRGKKTMSVESFDKSIRKQLKGQIGSELWNHILNQKNKYFSPLECKKSIKMSNSTELVFGMIGNVAELTSDQYLMGGSILHSVDEMFEKTTNPKKILGKANEPWIGFRNFAIVKP